LVHGLIVKFQGQVVSEHIVFVEVRVVQGFLDDFTDILGLILVKMATDQPLELEILEEIFFEL
jgi:hypothetical protein